jgi:beta-galactosidase
MGGAVDLVGLDYYNRANPESRAMIMRRTTELAVRTEALGQPAFACEMGAGFPPFFPPLDEKDSAFTVLAALAYGLRGFNAYMTVERDRWIGAPIDPHGRPRPFADFWRRLNAAFERSRFHLLKRRVPVRILTPRNERRIARVTHAFGPITGAFFSVSGAGPRDACVEDDLGFGGPPAIEVDTFVRAVEASLEALGVPFAHVGGEDKQDALESARWIVCATSGGLSPALFEHLVTAKERGAAVTLGPRLPELGGARRVLQRPFDLDRLAAGSVPLALTADPREIDLAVTEAVRALELPTWSCDPDTVHVTIHDDAEGRPRVAFVIQPDARDRQVRVALGKGVRRAIDLFDDHVSSVQDGVLELRVAPRSVRMLLLES